MILLIILLFVVWVICINAILIDAEREAEENKRKFWLVANGKYKPSVIMTGNGEATEEEFYR